MIRFPLEPESLHVYAGLSLRPEELPTKSKYASTSWIETLRKMLKELHANRNMNRVVSFQSTFDTLDAKLDGLKSQLKVRACPTARGPRHHGLFL